MATCSFFNPLSEGVHVKPKAKIMNTTFKKATYGNSVETMLISDREGKHFKVSTTKASNGALYTFFQEMVIGKSGLCRVESFDMYSPEYRRERIVSNVTRATEANLRSVHSSHLALFLGSRPEIARLNAD